MKTELKMTDRAIQEADLVIKDGKLIKNRHGKDVGCQFPFLPDGCYRVTKMVVKAERIEAKKNVLEGFDAKDETLHFDSISEPVYVTTAFNIIGLVIGAEYFVTAERDSEGDLVLDVLERAADDPLLTKGA